MTCERWQDTEVAPDRTHHLHGGGPLYTARFDEVLKFHAPGLAAVRCDDEAWHVDLNGMPAYGLRFRRTFGFYEGLAAVAADDGWRHILPGGTELSTARYAWCGNFQSGLCAVRTTSGEYFHIDSSGHPAYAERWRYAGDYRDGFAVIQRRDGMSTHIDRAGRTLHGRWFVDLDVFHKGYARARDDSGWFHVDEQGHPVYARRFAMAEPFYNGQARVETLNGGLEVISEQGLTLVRLRDDKALSAAHQLYKQGKFDEALKLNQQALNEASMRNDPRAQIDELRNVGLCYFRLHQYEESEKNLRDAVGLAIRIGNKLQELFLNNHLGATLREAGKLHEAYELFETSLSACRLPEHREARMRLLGSFGALLDELGQRHRADECYARYEELADIIGDANRQANARGLVARTLELRGELHTAKQKYEEETVLAERSGDVLRKLAAELHTARIDGKLGEGAEVREGFEVALQHSREVGNRKRLIDALEHFAEFLRKQRELPQSFSLLSEARKLASGEQSLLEKCANINARLASLCADVGLHGEALAYLCESVEIRFKLYEPLRRDKEVRKLAQTRLDELTKEGFLLIDEACQVARTEEEKSRILGLHNRLQDKQMSWDDLLVGRDTRIRAPESPWVWSKRIREESRERWQRRLLPGPFEKLTPLSQDDLVQADIAYSGPVDDLSRSLLLMTTVVERELRLRLVEPLIPNERLTLGELLMLLDEVRTGAPKGKFQKLRAALSKHHRTLEPYWPIIKALLSPLRLANGDVLSIGDGKPLNLVDVRNAVAHGNQQKLDRPVDRMLVDAVKRRLLLEETQVLRRLVALPALVRQ